MQGIYSYTSETDKVPYIILQLFYGYYYYYYYFMAEI